MHFLIRLIAAVTVLMVISGSINISIANNNASANAASNYSPTPKKTTADSTYTIKSLVSFANKHLHIPYRSGGTSKRGFDCSGFVRYCFDKWNIALPHSSAAQAEHGETIKLDDAKPGDLIFFKGESAKSSRIGHVGIITEVAPGYVKFIHSAFKGGIRYDLLNATYYSKRFVAVRRLVGR
ncbi:C40 family peptidase [Dyadobacter arcticus]|uniref:Cell wall-associated NlpC family hydrolase n=1 Tax=Dyadobacter arcticus TaxID=1078754 RepID=A0ABX0UV72_9BACT|nr:C40 family peptidase [Dyadobacter arcticus]NIJ55525.1 cell wall-associated NlpC family hydrolase [Dyadobacter arcticus]